MQKMILKLILTSSICFFLSCKSKLILTDENLNRDGRIEYKYDDNLTEKEIKYFSNILKTNKNQITNTKLYVFIKSWEYTTYLYGGNNKNGIDCSALMIELFDYVHDEDLPRTSGEMYVDKRFIPLTENDKLEEGDLVFFKIDQTKIVSHVGIYLKNSRFFSASSTDGCSIASINSSYWKKYYVGASRLKN